MAYLALSLRDNPWPFRSWGGSHTKGVAFYRAEVRLDNCLDVCLPEDTIVTGYHDSGNADNTLLENQKTLFHSHLNRIQSFWMVREGQIES